MYIYIYIYIYIHTYIYIQTFIQNMPTGRPFLVSVVAEIRQGMAKTTLRSPWIRTATLTEKTRDAELGNLDPTNTPIRLMCIYIYI